MWPNRLSTLCSKHEADKLLPLVIAVLAATIIQSITSFSNTQLLSKAAQRMIADLRQEVQQHVGRLSVTYRPSCSSCCRMGSSRASGPGLAASEHAAGERRPR